MGCAIAPRLTAVFWIVAPELFRCTEKLFQTVFDYSGHMHRLIRNVANTFPEFQHIDADRLLVSLTHARSSSSYGLHAKTLPMRFSGGRRTITRRGYSYRIPAITINGREILYIIYFCMPRFQDQSFDDKLATVFHELYHISPKFNGDLRKLKGRNVFHGSSWKRYEQKMSDFAARYLDNQPDSSAHEFLKLTSQQLIDRYGEIVGLRIKEPQYIEIPRAAAAESTEADTD